MSVQGLVNELHALAAHYRAQAHDHAQTALAATRNHDYFTAERAHTAADGLIRCAGDIDMAIATALGIPPTRHG